jgi:integrase
MCARPIKWPPPIYTKNGKDFTRIRRPGEKPKDVTLGPEGSDEARAAYARLVAEEAAGRPAASPRTCTVGYLCAAYLRHASTYYEVATYCRIRTALTTVCSLYKDRPAEEFGPLAYQAVREVLLGRDYSRNYINDLMDAVKWAFRWGAAQEYVSANVLANLKTVAGLRRGKTTARETPKVRAVALADVEATLPHLPQLVADMVRFQLATGCRPGEACALRPCDLLIPWQSLEGDVEVWLYRLDEHKTDWRGCWRWIPIVPRAQKLLAPYLKGRPPEKYVFCPQEGRSSACNATSWPSGEKFRTEAYDQAILRGCKRAGTKWCPNQLRHLVATLVETERGREDARCVLGHSSPQMTAVYAEWTLRAARALAGL